MLDHFKDECFSEEDENGVKKAVGEPLFYWECVMSDSFAETVENMFYLSFLLKLKVIVCWVSLKLNIQGPTIGTRGAIGQNFSIA